MRATVRYSHFEPLGCFKVYDLVSVTNDEGETREASGKVCCFCNNSGEPDKVRHAQPWYTLEGEDEPGFPLKEELLVVII